MVDIFVTFDAETYFSSEVTLKKINTIEYVGHPDFDLHMIGYSVDDWEPEVCYSAKEFCVLLDRLSEQAGDGSVILIAHNINFDGLILLFDGYKFKDNIKFRDTASMASALYGSSIENVTLGKVVEVLGVGSKTRIPLETKGLYFNEFTYEQKKLMVEYCLNDVKITRQIHDIMATQLHPAELEAINITHSMFLRPGFHMDVNVLDDALSDIRDNRNKMWDKWLEVTEKTNIENIVILEPSDFRSTKKIAEQLELFNVKVPHKSSPYTGKRVPATAKTDKAFLKLLLHEDRRVRHLVDCRLNMFDNAGEQRIHTFKKVWRTCKDHRVAFPVPLRHAGARQTLRWSGADKMNLQNLPRGGFLREALIAPKGYKVVANDCSGVEMRIATTLMGNTKKLELIAQGVDIYKKFAEDNIYGTIKDDDPEAKLKRTVGKVAELSLQYGTGVDTFQHMVWSWTGKLLPRSICKQAVTMWRRRNNAARWWEKLECKVLDGIIALAKQDSDEVKPLGLAGMGVSKYGVVLADGNTIHYHNLRHRLTMTKFGRQVRGYEYTRADLKDKSVHIWGGSLFGNICQSLSRALLRDYLVEVNAKYNVHLTVHDEIVCVVPEDEADECLAFMQDVMSRSPEWWPEIQLMSEGSIGGSYLEAK